MFPWWIRLSNLGRLFTFLVIGTANDRDNRGRYYELYTKQAGYEANKFVNPGELAQDPDGDADPSEKPNRHKKTRG